MRFGHVDVGPGRFRVPRRMVVNCDDRARLELQRTHADLAGIDRRVADRAALMQLVRYETILAVQIQDPELLHLAVPGERAAILDHLVVVAEGRAQGVRHLGARHADAERLGGLDGGDGVPGEAGHGAQPVGPGGEDAGARCRTPPAGSAASAPVPRTGARTAAVPAARGRRRPRARRAGTGPAAVGGRRPPGPGPAPDSDPGPAVRARRKGPCRGSPVRGRREASFEVSQVGSKRKRPRPGGDRDGANCGAGNAVRRRRRSRFRSTAASISGPDSTMRPAARAASA